MAYVSNTTKAELDNQPVSCSGIFRTYAPKLKAFEHLPAVNPAEATTGTEELNTILFIGGLGADILSPHYMHKRVVPSIYGDEGLAGWRAAEVAISSSARGWGTGSVERDAEELAKCVYYYKAIRPNGKIIMMGHSTGCQDIFYMMTRLNPTPPVDGIILQAPVSDREALTPSPPVPPSSPSPPPSSRPAPPPGTPTPPEAALFSPSNSPPRYSAGIRPSLPTADFFSSDFSEDVILKYTWGRLKPDKTKVLVLYSEEDEWVPAEIDKEKLVATWIKIMKEKGVRVDEKNSGVVEEASHDLSEVEESVMQDVLGRIKRFLGWVAEGEIIDASG
ncbi:hypothetical protein BGX38DRAFT_1271754 [Terfezia claveryi]|nr:hypothetical protein BGX38DRAFT_1271754 [Terfezia claveryi]